MSVPTCGISHDVVIYDGLGNLPPIGLIVRPFTFRVNEAPNLVPRMAIGDPRGLDYEGKISWAQRDFRGGQGQTKAPNPSNTRYYRGAYMLPTREDGFMGVGALPECHSMQSYAAMVTTVDDDAANTNLWYGKEQRRWFYIHHIGTPGYGYRDRIITWAGAYSPAYTPGDTCLRRVCWGEDEGLCAIDACSYSGVVIVATQQSWYDAVADDHNFEPAQILVHGGPSYTKLVSQTSALAVTTYDGRLWRAGVREPYISWYDIESVNDSINPTWSDAIKVGSTGYVMRMTPFLGRLFIAKTDGIWAYEAGRTYRVIDYRHDKASCPRDCTNFDIFLVAHGALYWNMGNRIMRYTAGGLLEEMAGQLDLRPVAAATVRRGLAIITPKKLWILDTSSGGLFHVLDSDAHDLHLVGSERGHLHIAPYRRVGMTGAGHEAVLWALKGDRTLGAHAGEPREKAQEIWPEHGNILPSPTTKEVAVETSSIDLGYPGLIKAWDRVLVYFQNVFSSSWPGLRVYYRTEVFNAYGGINPPGYPTNFIYTLLGHVDAPPDDPGVAVLHFTGIASQAIQVRVALETSSLVAGDFYPIIFGIEVEGRPIRSVGNKVRRLQTRFNAVVTDDIELLNSTVENSAAYITTALYSLAGTGAGHVIALPYPPPVGHTVYARVELGATGAVVPVLPSNYSALPSGCPGSDVAIVITEL